MRLLALALPLVAAAVPCQNPPAPSGEIAFTRGGAILLVDAASGKERTLVPDNTSDRPIAWMPDGSRLLYWNHDGGAWDLWAIEVKTGGRTNLTANARDNRSPAPSPDGKRIAFLSGADGLSVMNSDGTDRRVLSSQGHRDQPPAWSPSGTLLAFGDLERGDDDDARMALRLVDANEKEPKTRLLGDGTPAFFVDEHHLVASADHAGENELVVVDVRDGSRRALTDSPAWDRNAVLTPDQRHIVWVQVDAGGSKVCVMALDGSGARDLAPIVNHFASPSVSPDGRHVAFESGDDRKKRRIYVVSIDGGEAKPVTGEGIGFPVWRPR
jgi:Tol biopolymer transport system component